MSREIKGPEDCIPHRDFLCMTCGGLQDVAVYTAQEVGQITTLMDKDIHAFFSQMINGPQDEKKIEELRQKVLAWRSLSEKLKGGI